MISIRGNCPMGCGPTLILGEGGAVICRDPGCPRPSAVHELLDDNEIEHVVRLSARDFDVQHPLRERLDGQLWSCDVHEQLRALKGPPRLPGTYRVAPRRRTGPLRAPLYPGGSIDTWEWTEVPS